MKYLSTFFFSFFLFFTPLMGATPYNLEGLQALNVLVLDENDILTLVEEVELRHALQKKLEKNGISSTKDGVGAMFVKINAIKLAKTNVVYITLGVGEETTLERDSEVQSYALTYSLNDMFETTKIKTDVFESAVNYLLDEFLEQFYEDNET